ncbi:MAG: hypothetical protein ABIF89_01710 [bacterium]
MASDELKEQLRKLYSTLPQELKDVYTSQETGDIILNTCTANDIEDKLSIVVSCVGNVLLGILPLNEFSQELKSKLKVRPEIIKNVSYQINRLIFFPVKESILSLYVENFGPERAAKIIEEETKKESLEDDTYREKIE